MYILQVPNEPITRNESQMPLYIATKTCLQKLVRQVQDHSRRCQTSLVARRIQRRGHVALVEYTCQHSGRARHKFWWASSPRMPNGKYLANERVLHGLVFSGMRPSHYTRFVNGANLGMIEKRVRRSFVKNHLPSLEAEYEESTENALQLEIGMTMEDPDTWQGIDVCTDARHGHRRNAKDTSMVAIGNKTKKVLRHIHITKARDHVTQRHELIGVKDFYEYMDTKDTPVRIHVHDRNMAVNAHVKKLNGPINQNDRWHGIKSLKKAIESVGGGRKRDHGKTWHCQLEDKCEPIGTHAHWAIDQCQGDADTLRRLLRGVVDHYSNFHNNCPPASRCQTDPRYEPSRIVLWDPMAKTLLCNAIVKSTLYRGAEDFVHGMNTSHVESFNNVMNMYHDKRIYYSDEEYLARSYISVLYWNENSGREFTSTWQPPVGAGSCRGSSMKRNYKPATYFFQRNVWQRYFSSLA